MFCDHLCSNKFRDKNKAHNLSEKEKERREKVKVIPNI